MLTTNVGSRITRSLLSIAALGLVAGCAAKRDPALDQLRTRYEAERPRLDQLAPVASDDARVAIDKVAGAVNSGAKSGEVTHLVYVANKRIDIAEARADERTATDEVAALSKERQNLELAARDNAAQRAQVAAASESARASEATARASDLEARNKALQSQLAELQARETDRGLVLTLGDVLFDVDRATLKPGARTSLEKLAKFLDENPDRSVEIEGHTDTTGSREHNEELSQARADSVASFLTSRGISSARIQSRGLAFDYPVATNDTAAGRQLNRRVEVVIANPTSKATSTSSYRSTETSSTITASPR